MIHDAQHTYTAAFVLQHATFSHPTSSLPKMSPCSYGSNLSGWPLGYEERRCWANCPRNYFLRFPTHVVLIHQRHRQTERQTDGRTDDVQSQYRAMRYRYRAVKIHEQNSCTFVIKVIQRTPTCISIKIILESAGEP